MKLRDILFVVAAGVWLLASLAWFFPVTAQSAIGRAKDAEVTSFAAPTYGELIARYEAATGTSGTWQAERTGDDYLWEVTYAAPGLDSPLWFGVKTRIGGVYLNDVSPMVVRQMSDVIAP